MLVMANLLPEVRESSLNPLEQRALELLAEGIPRTILARRLAKGDKKKAMYWRRRLATIQQRQEAQATAAMLAKGDATMALVPVTHSLIRRAKRGRVDAAKLLFEVSGFHNPRVQHEHSGEVSIVLKAVPRPTAVETTDAVDATVVEE